MTTENPDKCKLIYESPKHPRHCCEYPFIMLNDSTLSTCFKECDSIKPRNQYTNDSEYEKDRCCMMKCEYRVQGMLVDEEVDGEAIKASFGKHKVAKLTHEWIEIIKNAVDDCMKIREFFCCFLRLLISGC